MRFEKGSNSHAPCGLVICKVFGPPGPLLTNRVRENFKHGSVGGVGCNPGPYPAGDGGLGFMFVSFSIATSSVILAAPDLLRYA